MGLSLQRTYDRMGLAYENFLLKRRHWFWLAAAVGFQTLALGLLSPWMVLLLGLMLVLGSATLARFEWGFIVYLVVSCSPVTQMASVENPFGFEQGIYPTEIILAFLLTVWMTRVAMGEGRRFEIHSTDLFAFCFLFMAIVSASISYATWNLKIETSHRFLLAQIAQVGIYSMCFAAYWMALYAVDSAVWIRRAFVVMILLGAVLATGRIPGLARLWELSQLTFSRPALLMANASILALGLLCYTRGPRARWLLLLTLLPGSSVLRNIYWVSGWSGFVVGVFVVLFLRSRKAVLIAMFLVVGLVTINHNYFYEKVFAESEKSGDFHRAYLFEDAVRIWLDHPFLGVGPGNYYPVYSRYFAKEWNRPAAYSSPHNTYGDLLASTGIFAFVSFCLFLAFTGLNLLRHWWRAEDPVHKGLLLGTIGVLASNAVSSFLGDYIVPDRANGGLAHFSYAVYFWIILGLAEGLGRWHAQSSPPESPSASEASNSNARSEDHAELASVDA